MTTMDPLGVIVRSTGVGQHILRIYTDTERKGTPEPVHYGDFVGVEHDGRIHVGIVSSVEEFDTSQLKYSAMQGEEFLFDLFGTDMGERVHTVMLTVVGTLQDGQGHHYPHRDVLRVQAEARHLTEDEIKQFHTVDGVPAMHYLPRARRNIPESALRISLDSIKHIHPTHTSVVEALMQQLDREVMN